MTAGFGAAIAVHPLVGYDDLFHVAAALLGALLFVAGPALSYAGMMRTAPELQS